MIKTILFDIGGTIFDEEEPFSELFQLEKEALREAGIPVTDEEFDRAVKKCIFSFVPSLHKAVTWHFTKPDAKKCNAIVTKVRQSIEQWGEQYAHRPFPGIEAVLQTLSRSYVLALAGNASGSVREILDRFGILEFFTGTRVSGDTGLSKPDPKFFEDILRELGTTTQESVMVGDRLDNDIIPAKLLGMRTILVKTGLYAILEPRRPNEIPDATVATIGEVPKTIANLVSDSAK